MAASKEEFLDIIGTDVIADLDRLREMSFYGIPSDVRGQVWGVLLPQLVLSSSSRLSAYRGGGEGDSDGELDLNLDQHRQHQGYGEQLLGGSLSNPDTGSHTVNSLNNGGTTALEDILVDHEVVRVLKTELDRYLRRQKSVSIIKPAKLRAKVVSMVQQYLQAAPRAWHLHHAALVHVAAPFALVLRKESDANQCFRLLMRALDTHFGPKNGWKTLGRFLMLFRSRLPELFTHFEEEDLEAGHWASSWLQWLLCRELPLDCCLRLWDAYFAAPDGHGLELHSFVCLAILENFQADLIELEHGDLVVFLRHLPSLDMDRIIVQSQYLAHDFRFQ